MLIVWDYFGVVAQDSFWYTASELATHKNKDEHVHEMQLKADLGQIHWDEYCKVVSEDIGIPLDQVKERYKHHDIKPDVIRQIHSLKGHHKQVLLSNASGEYLLPIMHSLSLDTLFDDIFVSSKMGLAKPDPRAFLHVLDAMQSQPSAAIMIDDSVHNIEVAASVGMRTIHYSRETDIARELSRLL